MGVEGKHDSRDSVEGAVRGVGGLLPAEGGCEGGVGERGGGCGGVIGRGFEAEDGVLSGGEWC